MSTTTVNQNTNNTIVDDNTIFLKCVVSYRCVFSFQNIDARKKYCIEKNESFSLILLFERACKYAGQSLPTEGVDYIFLGWSICFTSIFYAIMWYVFCVHVLFCWRQK